MSKVKLDIISDPICPWCFIGKTELESALAESPENPFVIEWHPFQLNPDMPDAGMDRRAYLELKFGGKDGAIKAYAPIVERAEAMGLKIAFDQIKTTPNTINAHRLIHWAGLEQRQNAAVDALFAAYFQQGRDIGDIQTLCDIAETIGMDRSVVEKLFASDADIKELRDRDTHSRSSGVSGVPTFIVVGQHVVAGAQPAALWTSVIKDIKEHLAQTT